MKLTTPFRLFLIITWSFFIAISAHARIPLNLSEQITITVQELMEEQGIPGLSIAVVSGNDLIFADGFGYARTTPNKSATKDTVYGLASVSKVFTATAFMQLVERGQIALNAPVTNYLPNFNIAPPTMLPPGYHVPLSPITSHSLLIHYAGIPKAAPPRTDNPETPQSLSEFMRDLYRGAQLIYPPNFRYSYSNPGISVLGRIIEVVSEQDFESYMQRNLFSVLDMSRSSFSNRGFSRDMMNHLAQGYSRLNVPANRVPIRGVPAGNLHSSVVDVANFMKMYLNSGRYKNRQVLRKETIEEMFTIQNRELRANDPEHVGPAQGLVWILNNDDIYGNPAVARHNGKMVGFSSILMLLPEEKIGVVVLTNIRNPRIKPTQIARAVIEIVRGT